MLRLHRIEDSCKAAKHFRHGQHPERVPRGCCIDDDEIESTASSGTADFQKACQLVDPGQRQLQEGGDVFAIEPGSAQSYLFKCCDPAAKPASEHPWRVDFSGMQHTAADLYRARGGGKRAGQGIGKRGRWIGGDQQGTGPTLRGGYGNRRGAGRLADSPLSADESKAWGGFSGYARRPRTSRRYR